MQGVRKKIISAKKLQRLKIKTMFIGVWMQGVRKKIFPRKHEGIIKIKNLNF